MKTFFRSLVPKHIRHPWLFRDLRPILGLVTKQKCLPGRFRDPRHLPVLVSLFLGLIVGTALFAKESVILMTRHGYTSVIRTIITDSRGDLWLGSFGLGAWKHENGKMVPVVKADGKQPSRRTSKLIADGNRVLMATAGECFWIYDLEKKDWHLGTPPAPPLTMTYLHALLLDKQGNVLLGSVGSYAALLSSGTWQEIGIQSGLKDDWINDAVETPEGIWLAGSNGLSLLKDGKIIKQRLPLGGGCSPIRWSNPDTNCIIADGSDLFIGTAEDGAFRISAAGKETKIRGFRGNIQALLIWKNALYIAGSDVGLWRVDHKHPTELRGEAVLGPWEQDNHFKALGVGPQGELLVGTFAGTVYRSPDGASFSKYIEYRDNAFQFVP